MRHPKLHHPFEVERAPRKAPKVRRFDLGNEGIEVFGALSRRELENAVAIKRHHDDNQRLLCGLGGWLPWALVPDHTNDQLVRRRWSELRLIRRNRKVILETLKVAPEFPIRETAGDDEVRSFLSAMKCAGQFAESLFKANAIQLRFVN